MDYGANVFDLAFKLMSLPEIKCVLQLEYMLETGEAIVTLLTLEFSVISVTTLSFFSARGGRQDRRG